MKKVYVFALSAALMMSSCGTYMGTGAYVGGSFGSILGSAIGGLSDGPRGSSLGTIIGMAGGAAIGAAIGNAQEQKERQEVRDHYRHVMAQKAQQQQTAVAADADYDSGFDATNSGDDRLYDFNGTDYTGNYSAQEPTTKLPGSSSVEELNEGYAYLPALEVRNCRIVDTRQDNVISRGEICKVIFEVYNHGDKPLYDVQPTVVETTGNKHIYISPNMHIECIMPGKGIRYTAMLKADNRLKDGKARICVSVLQGNRAVSKVYEFNVPTRK